MGSIFKKNSMYDIVENRVIGYIEDGEEYY